MNGKQKIIIGKSFWWWSWAIFSKAILTRGMFWLGWANSKQIQNKSKDYLSWKTCFNIKITKIAWFICSRRKLQHIVMPDIKTRHITTNIKAGGKSRVKQVKKKERLGQARQQTSFTMMSPLANFSDVAGLVSASRQTFCKFGPSEWICAKMAWSV